jgi:phosphoribosylcarboxyaminoimidazole (NCAIR) mutase
MDTEGEPTSTDPRSDRGRRLDRPLGLLSLVGLLVVVIAVVVGFGTELAIASTDASVSTAQVNLRHAHKTLDDLRGQLASAKSESEAAGITLAGDSAELAKVQAALAQAQKDVVANGVNISALDSCLSGIEQILNQIAVGDVGGATSTLSSVEGTCKSAHPNAS